MTPILATQVSPGQRAFLQSDAAQGRAQALHLGRAPVDAADAQMAEKRRAAARSERVLIRARTAWVARGLMKRPEPRYDVLRLNGMQTELVAAGCVFWEEAVALASDALKGRVSVSMGGSRTLFAGRGAIATASVEIIGAKSLAGDEGEGWRRPAPGEFVEVKAKP